MRILRANLLDELNKPYVVTARAKGVGPVKLVLKYPVRIAINPFISKHRPDAAGAGLWRGAGVAGDGASDHWPAVAAVRSSTRTCFLAGSLLMWLAILTVVGILLSDLLLAWVDPRIRFE